ncbi:metal-dependent phosphohydrolase, partial [Pseudomonas frederiksbergensis]|nr:metal-dependent phosphohydrolase [Pseudomonas frederiksbergensis]
PQDPVYHQEGDVWTHTMMVVDALLADPAYQRASPDQQFVLFYAALLHDIAKPSCTVIDEITGKIGQPGHSRRGAVDARILLWQAGVPFEL